MIPSPKILQGQIKDDSGFGVVSFRVEGVRFYAHEKQGVGQLFCPEIVDSWSDCFPPHLQSMTLEHILGLEPLHSTTSAEA